MSHGLLGLALAPCGCTSSGETGGADAGPAGSGGAHSSDPRTGSGGVSITFYERK